VRELGLYRYDPTKQLEEPVKEDDHAVDALRYLVVGLDRGRPAVPPEPEESRREREAAERLAERRAALERDRAAQENPDDPRWWNPY
jgi:hypothetical protein